MRRSILLALAVIGFGGTSALADGALDEVSAGSVQATATSPRSAWSADKLGAIWEPGDAWQLRLDLTGTHDFGAKPSTASSFGDPGGNVLLVNVAGEYDPDDHWSFRIGGAGSPSSTTYATTTVPIGMTGTAMATQADAQLASTTWSASGIAAVGYDTAGQRDLETEVVATVTSNYFDSMQDITAVQRKDGQIASTQQLAMYCAAHTCSPQLVSALAAQTNTLTQTIVDGNVTEQLFRTTDLTFDAAFYFYDKDPTQVGYFSVTSAGRSPSGGGPSIAPLAYTMAPAVVHRFGQLAVTATLSYGKYVDAEGTDLTGNLKVQYRFKLGGAKRLKVWGKLSASRDVDQDNNKIQSGYVATGAQLSW